MSSAAQDTPDSILLPTLGESIMGSVVQTCTFTLLYGVHFELNLHEALDLNNFPLRITHTPVCTDNCEIPVSSPF